MTRNVGTLDRWSRAIGALALLACAALAPLPLLVRAAGIAPLALYLAFTAVSGTCFGYARMGRSSCPAPRGDA